MNMDIINNVCSIVDENRDANVAYRLAVEYINTISFSSTSNFDAYTISLVRKYLKYGSHPSEGIRRIFKDESVKNILELESKMKIPLPLNHSNILSSLKNIF